MLRTRSSPFSFRSALRGEALAPRGGRLLARLAAVLASASCGLAQTVLAPNVTWDGDDHDLADGRCDADAALPGDQCTLRAALQNAQLPGASGSWVIQLQSATYTLSDWGTDDTCVGGDLDVFADHSIAIEGFPGTTIDATPLTSGGHPERVFDVHPTPNPARRVELRFLVVRGGRAGGGQGGAIRHRGGELVLEATGLIDHEGGDGGALYVGAPLSMLGGEISFSTALGVGSGGGAHVDAPGAAVSFVGVTFQGDTAGQSGAGLWVEPSSSVTLGSCSFAGGNATRGGALAVGGPAGVVTADSCTFSANTSSGAGGAIALLGGAFQASQCTLSSNSSSSSGGAINVDANSSCNVRDSFFDANTCATLGGGIFTAGLTRIERSTLAQNTASSGGGIYVLAFAPGTMTTLVNSTLSQNDAQTGTGGGLRLAGSSSTAISSCSIVFNHASSAGGAGIWGDAPATVRGTLLFGNWLPFNVKQNFAGSVLLTSAHANVDSDGTCAFSAGSQSGTLAAPLDPQLGPLQQNGGFAPTHGFQSCGPAHGTGACDDVNGIALGVDERNFPRSVPCDVGAFEEQSSACSGPIVPFCAGDGLTPGMTPCPCFPGAIGHGCSNSATPMGALLAWTGVPCNNDVVLHASSMPATTTGIYLMGNATLASGVVFGDGVRCIDGTLVRLATVLANGGQSQFPAPGSLVTLAQRSGVIPCSGVVRYYQEYYRNAAALFCPPATFNVTNGLIVQW